MHLHNSLISNVGTTRFELATTRPPGVKQLETDNIMCMISKELKM